MQTSVTDLTQVFFIGCESLETTSAPLLHSREDVSAVGPVKLLSVVTHAGAAFTQLTDNQS